MEISKEELEHLLKKEFDKGFKAGYEKGLDY